MAKKETLTIDNYGIERRHATIYIEGDSDLILNKMNNSAVRELTADDSKKQKLWERAHRNKWEAIITSIHWRDPLQVEDTNTECSESMMMELLKNNAPCIPAFAFFKNIGEAVIRNNIDKYKTKIEASVNVSTPRGLVPVSFSDWMAEQRLMTPKKGSPVNVYLNHFSGWHCSFDLLYTTNNYSLEQIVNFINMAGFGLGIGSGRSSGYGRYHVVDVK